MSIKKFILAAVLTVSFLILGYGRVQAANKKPDLKVSYLGIIPKTSNVGKETTISFRILNDGNIYAKKGFLIKLFIDGKKKKQWKAQKPLNPGYPQSLSYKYKVKFNKPGKHEVKVEIITSQPELSKTNNVKVKYADIKGTAKSEKKKSKKKPKTTIPKKEKPDVKIISAATEGGTQFYSGDEIKFEVTARNSGASVPVIVTLNIRDANNDTVYDSHSLGKDIKGTLQKRKNKKFSFTWTAPNKIGKYDLLVAVRNSNISWNDANCILATHKPDWQWDEDSFKIKARPNAYILITEPQNNQKQWDGDVSGTVYGTVPSEASVIVFFKVDSINEQGRIEVNRSEAWRLSKTYPTPGAGHSVYAQLVDKNGTVLAETEHIFVRAPKENTPPEITSVEVPEVDFKKEKIFIKWEAEDDDGAENLTYLLRILKNRIETGGNKNREMHISFKTIEKAMGYSFATLQKWDNLIFTLEATDAQGLTVSKNFPECIIKPSDYAAQAALRLAKELDPEKAENIIAKAPQARTNIYDKIDRTNTVEELQEIIDNDIKALTEALNTGQKAVKGLQDEMSFLAKGCFGKHWKRFEEDSQKQIEELFDALQDAYEGMDALANKKYGEAIQKTKNVLEKIADTLDWFKGLASEYPPELNKPLFPKIISEIENLQSRFAYPDIIGKISTEITEAKKLEQQAKDKQADIKKRSEIGPMASITDIQPRSVKQNTKEVFTITVENTGKAGTFILKLLPAGFWETTHAKKGVRRYIVSGATEEFKYGASNLFLGMQTMEWNLYYVSPFKDKLLDTASYDIMVGSEYDDDLEIEVSNVKISNKYDIEDIEEQLSLNRDDLINGQIKIAGRTNDGRKGASIKKVEVDVDDGRGWQPASGRNRWEYKFRPSANQTYSIAIRVIDTSGEAHESGLEPVEVVYKEAGDRQIVRQIIYEFFNALDEEDIERAMALLAEDFITKPDGGDYEAFRDEQEDEIFPDREDYKDVLSGVSVSVSGSTARVTLIDDSTYIDTCYSTSVVARDYFAFTLKKRNGAWLITEMEQRSLPALDTTAPIIVSTSPADGATGISVDTDISITFNEPMNDHYSLRGPEGYTFGDWSYNPSTYAWTNTNGGTLSAGTTFNFIVNPSTHTNGFADASGNTSAADQTFSFTTE